MQTLVTIQSLKCEECKDTVTQCLEKQPGISNIVIDIKAGDVSLDYVTHNSLEGARMELAKLGFPITRDPDVIIERS